MLNSLGQARARPPDSDWLKLSHFTLVRFLGTGKNRTMYAKFVLLLLDITKYNETKSFMEEHYNFKRNISKEIQIIHKHSIKTSSPLGASGILMKNCIS